MFTQDPPQKLPAVIESPKPVKLFSIDEFLQVVPVSRSTVYRLIASGKLRAVRVGGRTLFDAEDVCAFIRGYSRMRVVTGTPIFLLRPEEIYAFIRSRYGE